MWRTLGLCVFVVLRAAHPAGSEAPQSGELIHSAVVPAEAAAESDESRLDPDRPHLPEASTAVGKGRVALEGGYTAGDGAVRSQTFPELILRVGAFADWFEVRAGETFLQKPQVRGLSSSAAFFVTKTTRPPTTLYRDLLGAASENASHSPNASTPRVR